MIRHPSRHYIRYLLSRRTLDAAAIVVRLGELKLPVPQEAEVLTNFVKLLKRERDAMHFPTNFEPQAESPNAETVAFLQHWKIEGMWRHDPYVGYAGDLLGEPQLRRAMDVSLLGPLAPAGIAQRLRARFGFTEDVVNTQVVRAYAHYYWDYNAMDTAEWRTLLRYWYPMGHETIDMVCALQAPRSKLGAVLTLSLSDKGTDEMGSADMFNYARNMMFRLFMEHALTEHRSFARTQAAFTALQAIKLADEEVDKRRGASAELLEELRKMDTTYDHARIATVHDLPALKAPVTHKEEIPDGTE